MERLMTLTVNQLRDQLKVQGLDWGGKKLDLAQRLHEALVAKEIDIEGVLKSYKTREDQGDDVLPGPSSQHDVRPEDSMSQASCRSRCSQGSKASSGSRLSDSLAIAAADRASLEARVKALEKLQVVEQEEMKLKQEEMKIKQKKERIMLEADLEAIKMKEKTLQQHEVFDSASNLGPAPLPNAEYPDADKRKKSQCDDGLSNRGENYLGNNVGVCGVNNSLPVQLSSQQKLLETLVSYNIRSKVPEPVIKKFDGDLVSYRTFIKAFDNIIASRLDSDSDRLFFLEQYTVGEPNEIVQSCLLMSSDEGYREARSSLEWRYGDPERIATAYVEKVLSFPEIKHDDVEALDKFAILLSSCKNAMSQVPYGIGELQNAKTLRRILQKVPYSIQENWRRKVSKIREEECRSIGYEDLVAHVISEVKVARDPQFGKHLFKSQPSGVRGNKGHVRVNLAKGNVKCWFCEGPHLVFVCEVLESMSHDEKIESIKGRKLCFSCLRLGHMSKFCRNKQVCEKCNMQHPTILHKESVEGYDRAGLASTQQSKPGAGSVGDSASGESHEVIMFASVCGNNTMSGMSVVPVRIKANNGNVVQTYAFLDGGSEASFCTQRLLNRLGIGSKGTPVSLSVSTMNGNRDINSKVVSGLSIGNIDGSSVLALPPVYTIGKIPVEVRDVIRKEHLSQWDHLTNLELPTIEADVELLVGNNAPHLLEPWEVIHSSKDFEPHAVRTRLGWIVCGALDKAGQLVRSNRIAVKNSKELDQALITAYNKDFEDCTSVATNFSREDLHWLDLMKSNCRLIGGQYELPLPLKIVETELNDTKGNAMNRLFTLRKRLIKNKFYKLEYIKNMQQLLSKGYAEKIPSWDCNGGVWYIPHFGVTHPAKPGKVRIVFDCASKVKGKSLNDFLMKGPDLNNLLLDVIIRFREGLYAYTADVEGMFLQVKVPEHHRDYLRFLWWDNESLVGDPLEYRMTVHLFGATSSPSCATFALRQTVLDNGQHYTESVGDTIFHNFYVDDCLKSIDSVSGLIDNAKGVQSLCKQGGFKLNKFTSNLKEFIDAMPEECLSKSQCELIEEKSNLLVKTLGLVWELEGDLLRVQLEQVKKPLTKRQLLACIAGIYDPLGFAAPWVLEGRLILQELCRNRVSWDKTLEKECEVKVVLWISKLNKCGSVSVPRCYKTCSFEDLESIQLHYFADSSEKAYGVAVYVRTLMRNDVVEVRFLMGKGRVAPLKGVSIPRLELSASYLAVKMHMHLKEVVKINYSSAYFWTDSKVVLYYIRNDRNRYQTFVSNRVSFIREGSDINQWRYINTDMNPADDISRARQSKRWLDGPPFLSLQEKSWPGRVDITETELDHPPEIKQDVKMCAVGVGESKMKDLFERYSSWMKLLRAVSFILKFLSYIFGTTKFKCTNSFRTLGPVSAADVECSMEIVIRLLQEEVYWKELKSIKTTGMVRASSPIGRLRPIYEGSFLRVGGRLAMAMSLSFDSKHPIILPGRHHVTRLIVRYYHEKHGHMGGNYVLGIIRQKYWVTQGHATVRSVVRACVQCRKVKGVVMNQQMADLPEDRSLYGCPPFQICGVDCFGPFYVKYGRGQVKRWGVIFTCLAIRAIHLEMVIDMSTDAFINSLRRFISRRGNVKKIYCDRGTNFVGASAEIGQSVSKLDDNKILRQMSEDGIEWVFGPPSASHFGGIWERMIRTVRRVLESIISSQALTDDKLSTVLCEVESIVNSRPLTTVSSDSRDLSVLTPSRLLNIGPVPHPIGEFHRSDSISKRRWRQVQYCAEQFWTRWRREYFSTLQERQKWKNAKRNLKVGDVVLITDENTARSHWPLATVVTVKASTDGLVRSAGLKVGLTGKVIERPLSKLIMILEDENH